MESVTKNRQPPATLQAMIGQAFGQGLVPAAEPAQWCQELGEGWFNVAYRLTLADGQQTVLKISPAAALPVLTYERGMMRNELEALRLLRGQAAVPVPAVEYADTSHRLIDADWFFMSHEPGRSLDSLVKGQPEGASTGEINQLRQASGAVNRQLNQLRGKWFGPLLGPGLATWRQAFSSMVEAVLADGERAGVNTGHRPEQLRQLLAERADALADVPTPYFVEWDLWDGNLLVQGGQITSVIDHERAFWGDPLMEHGFAGVVSPGFGDPGLFLRGYGRRLDSLTARERTRIALYNLHRLLVLIIEPAYRHYPDDSQYDWAREQLDRLVRQLVSTS